MVTQDVACEALVELIKEHGMWKDKDEDADAESKEGPVEEEYAATALSGSASG